MGIVLLVDQTLPKKNDLHLFSKPKSYTMDQFNKDYRILDGVENAISNKYSTSSLSMEAGENINALFRDHTNNIDDILKIAQQSPYPFLAIATLKINSVDRTFIFTCSATIKADCNIKIVDVRNGKILFDKTFSEIGIGSGGIPDSLQMAAQNCDTSFATHIQTELPPLNN